MTSTPSAPSQPDGPDVDVDVAVLGGGIAGLTLARQLSRAAGTARIAVIERDGHPVTESAHKVGESSVEMQAHYLRVVLGLKEHLEADHLRKFGLRMFFPAGDNTDIARRVEFGQIEEAPLPSYQLDRGRLENHLGDLVRDAGVDFQPGQKVVSVDLATGPDRHTVTLASGVTYRARWVIDASGRAGLLKRQLGLAQSLPHRSNAAWFRIDHPVDVGAWSSDPHWQARVPSGLRRLSTNHLMGHGYWVWIIPLATGATSVGIVAEDSAHALSDYNTLPRALDWLARHEPQLAADVTAHQEAILDFRVMRDYAYGAAHVYDGTGRWCLTGEAGVSIDPLYSSGGDLMAISNGLITDLIVRDLAGQDVTEVAAGYDQIYLIMAQIWLLAYQGQYPVFGNPKVMVAKVIWDTIIYWAVPGLLYFHDAYRALPEGGPALPALYRTWEIHTAVQQFLRDWAAVEPSASTGVFADPYSLLDFMVDLHTGMAAGHDPDQLQQQMIRNVELLEHVSGQMATLVADRLATVAPTAAAAAQLQAWEKDPLLAQLRAAYAAGKDRHPVDPAWISLGDNTDHVLEKSA